MSGRSVFGRSVFGRSLLSRVTAPLVVVALSAAALTAIAGVVTTGVPASAAVSAGGFVGVSPNRLLDTREAGQAPCVTGTRNLTVTGGATTVPVGASAVALNVTVVAPTLPGFLTVFPAGAVRPTASNVNYSQGEVVPNGVFVKVGTAGAISLFALQGCPNVIVDVLGYFDGTTPVAPGGFVGVTPNRLLDTRNFFEGPCVTGTRNLTVTGGTRTVPDGASAVALNVTVVSPTIPGYVTVYPAGDLRPKASNVNYMAGQIVPNNVTVKVGTGGQISLYASGGCPNMIVDVVGYYQGGTPVLEGGFVGVTPNRLVDTRESGQGPCVAGVRNLTVAGGTTTVPGGANAVALNVTVVSPLTPGYLTVFSAGATRPPVSTLNYVAGQVVPNGTVVKVGAAGAISLYTNSGCPHVIVDVVGYYQGTTIPPITTTVSIPPVTTTSKVPPTTTTTSIPPVTTTSKVPPTTTTTSIPPAPALIAITTGGSHTCAVISGGTVKCWGDNSSGQLGNGTTTNSSVPVLVSGLTGVTAITAGIDHTCAAISGGTVKCWGGNSTGELGNGTSGTPIISSVPVLGSGLTGVTGVTEITTNSSVPVLVTGISTATAITAGGNHTCALISGGTVKCWGYNYYGQLGNGTSGTPTISSVPVLVSGLTGVTGITTNSSVPVLVSGLTGVTAITADAYHTCALISGGTVKCWGRNSSGELGNGTTTNSSVPVLVSGLTGVTAITAGDGHTCALISGGTVKCWGRNWYGQLGNGTTTNSSVPVLVSGFTGVTSITAGAYHSCALISGGTVKCWGYNYYGQLGNGTTTNSSAPVSVSGLTEATSITAGTYHSCAVISGGTVKCWGYNDYGQLGNRTTTNSRVPVSVTGL